MNLFFLGPIILAFVVCAAVIKLMLTYGHRIALVARPDHRRRHERETPTIGGVGVLIGWASGILTYCALRPDWAQGHLQSLLVLSVSAFLLHGLGLWDDLVNIGPYRKLGIQSLIALSILRFEPNIHALLIHWQGTVGVLSWVFGYLWIVGVTNAINLIDGLDGLAGGMSILAGCTILTLLSLNGDYASSAIVSVMFLIPSLFAFLGFNWNPARIFLGDNGSLPVGMLLSSASLMGYAQTKSWVMILSLALVFGYPILDMSICVIKRYRSRQALFKGDRIHLHFRIMKLGLTARQVALLLLTIGVYLQIAAVTVNLMTPLAATIALIAVFFSIFTLLFLVRSIERGKVNRIFAYVSRKNVAHFPIGSGKSTRWRLLLDIAPVLEKSTNQRRAQEDILALQILLRGAIRPQDSLELVNTKLVLSIEGDEKDRIGVEKIRARVQGKVDHFIELFDIECATATLPIEIREKSNPESVRPHGTC